MKPCFSKMIFVIAALIITEDFAQANQIKITDKTCDLFVFAEVSGLAYSQVLRVDTQPGQLLPQTIDYGDDRQTIATAQQILPILSQKGYNVLANSSARRDKGYDPEFKEKLIASDDFLFLYFMDAIGYPPSSGESFLGFGGGTPGHVVEMGIVRVQHKAGQGPWNEYPGYTFVVGEANKTLAKLCNQRGGSYKMKECRFPSSDLVEMAKALPACRLSN